MCGGQYQIRWFHDNKNMMGLVHPRSSVNPMKEIHRLATLSRRYQQREGG